MTQCGAGNTFRRIHRVQAYMYLNKYFRRFIQAITLENYRDPYLGGETQKKNYAKSVCPDWGLSQDAGKLVFCTRHVIGFQQVLIDLN